jgi:predicted nucleotide-binding protein
MAKKPTTKARVKASPKRQETPASRRKFPHHTLEEALPLAQAIADEVAGKPMNRLLLADALGLKPSSSNFRDLLSSAYKYSLTDGTEKSDAIGLTEDIGKPATQRQDAKARSHALRAATLKPTIFSQFFEDYRNKKLPSDDMFPKILAANYDVPKDLSPECARLLTANARLTGMLRDIGGSPHILFEEQPDKDGEADVTASGDVDELVQADPQGVDPTLPAAPREQPLDRRDEAAPRPKPIFIGHGKNTVPLQKVEALLSAFQIPYKATVREANLGRPIPQKVKDTMLLCASAILIFTKDEQFFNDKGEELWRPSENVVHELGASSYAYADRIVIFKERGLHFPSNFQSIGYIEFDVDSIESKTAELLKELIGFGLVKVTPT